MKKIIRSPLVWILSLEILLMLILHLCGFKITYAPSLENNWEAIGAVGEWAGALVGFLIPLAVIYIQAQLDKKQKEIGESNSDLLNELKEFKVEYIEKMKALAQLVDQDGNITIDGGDVSEISTEKIKEKALKFINISMMSNTNRVAEHLGISKDETFDLLEEMLRHDQTISCGGQCNKQNIDNIVWIKKKR